MDNRKNNIKFPKWLPKTVAAEAHNILIHPLNPEIETIIKLLTTRDEMRPVWKRLSLHPIQPKGRLSVLSEILSSIGHWNFMEEEGLLLSPKEKEKLMSEITDAIENLRRVLKKHHLHIWDYDPDTLSPIDMELDSVEEGLKYSFFWSEFPTKINAGSAKRTFLSKRLITFMNNQYQKSFDAEIATIIGLIFNDQEITDAHIRGLKKDM